MKLKAFMPVIIISQSLICQLALRVMFPVRTANVGVFHPYTGMQAM